MIEIYNEFEIEDLGIQEEWVYDIEVENNHNFFGNNILVHNSVYYHIEPFVEAFENKNTGCTLEDKINFCDSFEIKIIQPLIQQCIKDFSNELNAFNQGVIGAEREIIADETVFVAKKKYFSRVRDSEGVRYPLDDPYIKVMGLEIIKSGTPTYSKKHLKDAIPMILDLTEEELKTWLQLREYEYQQEHLGAIASVAGVSNLDYKLGEKGVPIGARSALVHNHYLRDNNLLEQFAEISAGDKTKRLYLLEPNPLGSNVVAFLDDRFIQIFKEYIDYELNFEKGFKSPLNIMTKSLGWNLNKTTESLLDDW